MYKLNSTPGMPFLGYFFKFQSKKSACQKRHFWNQMSDLCQKKSIRETKKGIAFKNAYLAYNTYTVLIILYKTATPNVHKNVW